MAILGIVLLGLVLFFVLGLPFLIAGILAKKHRRGLLIPGCVLCAPLPVFFLLGAVGALIAFIGDKL